MRQGVGVTISYAISYPGGPNPASVVQGPGPIQTPTFLVSFDMRARLEGSGFQIDPPGDVSQSIAGSAANLWEWQVTPIENGTKYLRLTVVNVVQAGGVTATEEHGQPFTTTVNVEPDQWYATQQFVATNRADFMTILMSGGGIGGIAIGISKMVQRRGLPMKMLPKLGSAVTGGARNPNPEPRNSLEQ
jgi:hypothetical protein